MIPSFHCSITPIAERSGAKFTWVMMCVIVLNATEFLHIINSRSCQKLKKSSHRKIRRRRTKIGLKFYPRRKKLILTTKPASAIRKVIECVNGCFNMLGCRWNRYTTHHFRFIRVEKATSILILYSHMWLGSWLGRITDGQPTIDAKGSTCLSELSPWSALWETTGARGEAITLQSDCRVTLIELDTTERRRRWRSIF